jgi:hypothetical protein
MILNEVWALELIKVNETHMKQRDHMEDLDMDENNIKLYLKEI